jgi:hypothetical protein
LATENLQDSSMDCKESQEESSGSDRSDEAAGID